MLSFDLHLFCVQALLFFFFLFFFSKAILGPVYRVLEERRRRLNHENGHATEALRVSSELKETRRVQIEEIHKQGALILREMKEKAGKDAQSLQEEAHSRAAKRIEEQRRTMRDLQRDIAAELDAVRGELLSTLRRKLWGGGAS